MHPQTMQTSPSYPNYTTIYIDHIYHNWINVRDTLCFPVSTCFYRHNHNMVLPPQHEPPQNNSPSRESNISLGFLSKPELSPYCWLPTNSFQNHHFESYVTVYPYLFPRFPYSNLPFLSGCPLVNSHSYGKWAFDNRFTYEILKFSIAMLVYQRVNHH